MAVASNNGEGRKLASSSCTLCPDVVEWCPSEGFTNLMAVGLYEHDEQAGVRRGSVQLVKATIPTSLQKSCDGQLQVLAEAPVAGAYDVAWSPDGLGPPAAADLARLDRYLAVAAADGVLRLMEFESGHSNDRGDCRDHSTWRCKEAASVQLLENSILTHVAWGAGEASGLAAVGQDGACHYVKCRPDGSLVCVAQRQAHDLEAWSVEVSSFAPYLVLTGADDAKLAGWDIRESPDSPPAIMNRKSHGAGVTALSADPFNSHILATGSYDERVRLFDLRFPVQRPLAETECLGDGSYHLSWNTSQKGVLGVAAMRSGLAVFLVGDDADALTEYGQYAAGAADGEHGSLAYGLSWQFQNTPSKDRVHIAASASFYDRSLHLWTMAYADST